MFGRQVEFPTCLSRSDHHQIVHGEKMIPDRMIGIEFRNVFFEILIEFSFHRKPFDGPSYVRPHKDDWLVFPDEFFQFEYVFETEYANGFTEYLWRVDELDRLTR